MSTIIAIARKSLLVWLALLGLAVGTGMIGYAALSTIPARASLQTAEGVVSDASRVTRTSRRTRSTSVHYDITLRLSAGGAELKLRVPGNEIGETDVRSLIGRTVRAEFDSAQDVYVLRSGNREVLTYQNTVERRQLALRQYHVDGIALLLGSSLVMLLGFGLGYRKLRRQAAAQAALPAGL